jgi:hypothetical protein
VARAAREQTDAVGVGHGPSLASGVGYGARVPVGRCP